ncbi:MAG TPA: hypothetical protein VFX16_31150 [Pseudonocardiaceae bacterium]|nr:hypothetical protein [Pseudonocardiaceae bacterium]
MSAQQIYENFHQRATGTGGLTSAQRFAQELADWYPDSAVSVQKLVDGIQSGWQGDAAEAASQGLTPLAENSLTTGQQLDTAQDLISRQVGSFHTAVSEVRPVPSEPSMVDTIGAVLLGQAPVPMLAQMAQHNAVQQANVDAYQKYVSASQYNTTNLPLLAESVAARTTPITVAPMTVTETSAVTGTAATPHLSSATRPVSTGTTTVPGQVVPQADSVPTAPTAGSADPAAPQGSGAGVGAGATPTTMASAAPPVTMSAAMSTTPAAAATGSAPSPGRQAGPTGIAVPPGVGRGEPAVTGDVRGGARGGAAPGAGSVEEETLPGERIPGSTSTTGGPMMGSRGARGDADAQHKRKYGVDEDGETRFGIAEYVAPRVIGEEQ